MTSNAIADQSQTKSARVALWTLLLSVFGATAIVGTASVASAKPAPSALVLPAPSLSTPIGTRSLHWIDRSRPDPLAADGRRRELMVQLWYPSKRSTRPYATYMSRPVAEFFAAAISKPASFLHASRTHARESAPAAAGKKPVVVLDTGQGLTRSFYTLIAEDLAAHGFVVVAVDHTHEAAVVAFPGGRVVRNSTPAPKEMTQIVKWERRMLDVRKRDIQFVLDRLPALVQQGRFAGRLDLEHVGVVGHSTGGAVAGELLRTDPRVDAAVNLDGYISGEVAARGLDRPYMVLNGPRQAAPKGWPFTEGYSRGPGSLWARLRGPGFSYILTNASHYTFSDAVAWQRQVRTASFKQVAPVGAIPAERGLASVRAYINSFFQRYLRDRHAPLLDGHSAAYPEMRFVP